MPDSDFWRDLAREFRAIDPHGFLRADWSCSVRVGEEPPPVATWRLPGGKLTRSVQLSFEALARRAGPKVHPLMDSLVGWLEALRESGFGIDQQPGFGIETDENDKTVGQVYFGTISCVCLSSADLCKHYESVALETERLANLLSSAPNAKTDTLKVKIELRNEQRETFPKRAEWLRERLAERGWDHNDPPKRRGPDRKTVLKILNGGDVRGSVLESLAQSLSEKYASVGLLDIPRD